MIVLAELVDEARRLSRQIDAGVDVLRKAAARGAHAEYDYRMAIAKAYVTVGEGTVPERQAQVQADTAGLRLVRDLAEGQRVAALEALRSRRAQLSALQSLLAAHRSEADHAYYGPEETP